LERDQQAQSTEEVLSMRADPELKAMVDWPKAVKQIFSARNLDILLPDEKIDAKLKELAEQPPPADPQLEVAKVRAEGEIQKAKMIQEADSHKLQFNAEQSMIDREHEIQIKMMDRDIKAMELSASSGIALDKIKAQLSETAAKLKVQTKLALAPKEDVKPAPQVSEPIAEPPGRAESGRAYQD